ncbi:DUF6794 domain-containing protein [Nonlabens ulvanivorans]|uniref:DUF6794 domain-containing protein n=1 Tax=Nonlabens ulvanivorans TaxID=906888 RepID=UPI0037C937FE
MKRAFNYKYIVLMLLLLGTSIATAQDGLNSIPVSETFSENGSYKIKSIAFDNTPGNIDGVSYVYDGDQLMYQIPRSFDMLLDNSTRIVLSNDGKIVVYYHNKKYRPEKEFDNVVVYKEGLLFGSFTTEQYAACSSKENDCTVLYNNYDAVIDYKRSDYGKADYKKVLRSMDEDEEWLHNKMLVIKDNIIYTVSGQKKISVFHTDDLVLEKNVDFEKLYPFIKDFPSPKTVILNVPKTRMTIDQFTEKKSGETLNRLLEKRYNLKSVSKNDKNAAKEFQLYNISMSGYMTRFGFLELTSLNIDAKFNKEDLVKYIDDINFDPATIDNVLPKQYFNYYAMSYRNPNDNVARDEKIAYDKALKQERIRRERLDTINGFFIPRSLEESFLQLDKIMPEKERKILVSLENQPDKYNSDTGGLGIWIRTNWGIIDGSRLQTYFNERNLFDPKKISAIIVAQYIKYLKKESQVARNWERTHPRI